MKDQYWLTQQCDTLTKQQPWIHYINSTLLDGTQGPCSGGGMEGLGLGVEGWGVLRHLFSLISALKTNLSWLFSCGMAWKLAFNSNHDSCTWVNGNWRLI